MPFFTPFSPTELMKYWFSMYLPTKPVNETAERGDTTAQPKTTRT